MTNDGGPAVDTSRDTSEQARAYLIRNVIVPLHPTCVPRPDLMGICTQVDNITAGLKAERDAATARAEFLRTELDLQLSNLDATKRELADLERHFADMLKQRDAATAERDRFRHALDRAEQQIDYGQIDSGLRIMRAALAPEPQS